MNNTVVTCRGLTRKYGDIQALSEISLDIEPGEIFGLIGPDGGGKTTLFRILATLILADSGTASVLGYDVVRDFKSIRRSIGYMPGRFSLYQDLTVEENLKFYASVFGVKLSDNYHLIEGIFKPLEPFRSRRAGKLSGGMKQKLALACALIHNPQLIILDEPTTGVDAVSRKEFWDHLGELRAQGMTLLVSTPYMDEAQRCDRLAMMHKGMLLDTGTPDEIRSRFNGALYCLGCSDHFKALDLLRQTAEVNSVHSFGQVLHVTLKPGTEPEFILKKLNSQGINQVEIEPIQPGMEDCFMMGMSS